MMLVFEAPSGQTPPGQIEHPFEMFGDRLRLTPAALMQTALPRGGIARHAGIGRGNELETVAPPPLNEEGA